jgi:uncharacterized membrane protein (DUF373 family)
MNQNLESTRIGNVFSYLPVALYVISAGILTIIAAFLLFEGIQSTLSAIQTETLTSSSGEIFNALFHAATAIALLETIEVFFRTHRLVVEVLFLAGIAEVIRHILVYDIAGIAKGDITASLVLLGGLITGILLYQHLSHKFGFFNYPVKSEKRARKRNRKEYPVRGV